MHTGSPSSVAAIPRQDPPALDHRSHVVSGWVARDGVRLHHLRVSGGSGTVVVVPGITSPAVSWLFVAEALRDLASVLILDLRGRGLSDAPANGYSDDDLADDLQATLDAANVAAPIVIGHALGARIVARWAGRQAASVPTVLVDPPTTGPNRPPYATPLESFERMLEQAARGTDAAEVAELFPDWPVAELELRARWVGTCDAGAVRAGWRDMHRRSFTDLWRSTPAPTLLIRGAGSNALTRADLDALAAVNPGGDIAEVAGAGHMVPWNQLDGFLVTVRPFLKRHLAISRTTA